MTHTDEPTSPKMSLVVGTRPNLVKAAALVDAYRARARAWTLELVHTGQHYDDRLSRRFFAQLALPEPAINLNVGSGSITTQTARIIEGLETWWNADRPALVVVVGDVTSTFAAALTAKRLGIQVAHVEAGLRSFDREMPEELNRVLTDAMSDVLFATEPSAVENLRNEGADPARIHFVGNPMIDTLGKHRSAATRLRMAERFGLRHGDYVLVTLHRPSNVDDGDALSAIVASICNLARKRDVIFPVHPRTVARLWASDLMNRLAAQVRLVDPQPYLEFIGLIADAGAVLTDSGGIQEETTALGIPCITMRRSTERPVTIQIGTNVLATENPVAAVAATRLALTRRRSPARLPEKWDGRAGRRIINILDDMMTANQSRLMCASG